MKLHELHGDKWAKKRRRRIARGNAGRAGTYAGRGRKGQNSRSGSGRRPYFEGGQLPFVRRLPFRRGFTNIFKVSFTPVNLAELDERFAEGDEVTPDALAEAGLLRGADEPYKVLARGEVHKSLTVQAPRFSAAARERIEAAGGRCVELEHASRPEGMGRPHPRK